MLSLNATLRSAATIEKCFNTLPIVVTLEYIILLIKIAEKMKLPLYVCVTCTQSFTRRRNARRHNFNLHFNQGIIVQMLEYIIGRSCGHFLPPNQLSNRRFRRPTFIRNQKMDNLESGFGATIHEPSHHLSNKITQNERYDEFSHVSNHRG